MASVRLERTTSGFVDLRSDSIELRSREIKRGREDLNLQPVRSKRTALNPLSYALEILAEGTGLEPVCDCSRQFSGLLPHRFGLPSANG